MPANDLRSRKGSGGGGEPPPDNAAAIKDTRTRMRLTLILSVALMVVYCGQSVLITASKNDDGGYDYSKNTSVLLSELAKLLISLLLLWRESQARAAAGDTTPLTSPVGVSCLRYAVPAILYAVHNNFIFRGLPYLGPATYQLFNNLKIVLHFVVQFVKH